MPLDPIGHLIHVRPHYQDTGSKQLYLIHRNKHREAAKMRRQRNMAQMKEQNKTPEKQVKMETSYLLDAEFKTLVIGVLNGLSKNFNSIKKDIETIKKNQSEMSARRNK